jgi:osmotically-inducible protein OsmY
VTRFGMVPSQTARAVAESEVRQVRWVRAVENKLQVVRPEQKQRVAAEDGAIRATVESALDSLKERSSIDTSKIDVDVSNRVVRLRGTVASQKARVAAVATASASPGVHAVEDELRVGTAPAG